MGGGLKYTEISDCAEVKCDTNTSLVITLITATAACVYLFQLNAMDVLKGDGG